MIARGEDRDAKKGRAAPGGDDREISAGGPLDVSWLNSRGKDTVGRNMEAELWAKARELVERLQGQGGRKGEDVKDEKRQEQEEEELEEEDRDEMSG